MKITGVESLHADAGWRNFDFLKISTDEGIVGWSEYNESFGGRGVSAVIAGLAPALIGKDPRAWEAHVALMYALRRQATGGAIQQAIGAIENALLDVTARALGVPVYALFGGPVRERIRLYWSHCATYRVSHAREMDLPPVRTLDDIVKLGREVVAKGYTALKTNVLLLGDDTPRAHVPGFARGASFPELNADRHVIDAIRAELAAFREGVGSGVDIMVDLNFNYKTDESLKIAAMADTYETNVAPHNFYGHLATKMNAHFGAVVPNLRIMEIDPDMVPWQDDLVTMRPRIEDGHLVLPTGPGWGTEVNEDAVGAHPPRVRR